VWQIQLRDCFIEHQALGQDGHQVIIDQVAWEWQIAKSGCILNALSENLSFGHLHAEQLTLILHLYVLSTKRYRKVRQVRQVTEKRLDVEVFKLCDNQAKDIVLRRFKFLDNFAFTGLVHRLKILQYALNVVLNVRLFETAPVKLFFYVLQLLNTFLFPIKFIFYVTSGDSDR
jgi:hypothetical protein